MQRLQQLEHWLATALAGRAFELAPASADASFRRYFRLQPADGSASLIVMDAPPAQEDIRPWLQIRALLAGSGLSVPAVHAADAEQGFVLMDDFGSTTYLQALRSACPPDSSEPDLQQAAHLYADALGALLAMQAASRPGVLPDYDEPLLRRELELFPEWYVGRHLGLSLDDQERRSLDEVFERILAVNLAEPRVFVHRDFHARNLMLLSGEDGLRNPGIIDFQDAVYGPLSYDLVSLFKDAYICWEEDFVLDMLIRYWEMARRLGLPVRSQFDDFHRDFEWMGVQRHLKVLGIFARLHHRDGKDHYLADLPQVLDYLRRTCKRWRELAPLYRLLDRIAPEQVEFGYTF